MQPHIDALKGLSKAEAFHYAKKHIINLRIAHEDAASYALTRDYKPERLNLRLVKGVVTDVFKG
jgi:hypothetical protein